jgi:uncharacterized protein (TIGR02453 family)
VPETTFFTPEVFVFLKQLKRNNNREWFAKNKLRYEECVVKPAVAFISAFAQPLHDISPHLVADARPTRGSLFRIYRDTRFSPDKKPYKTQVGMHFFHAKGRDAHAPGFYFHIEPGQCFVGGGIWHPDNAALTKIRAAITREPEVWARARGRLLWTEDTLKKAPRGFPADHPFVEDLKLKSYIASVPLPDERICSDRFLREFTAECKKMAPLVEFTTKALGLKF